MTSAEAWPAARSLGGGKARAATAFLGAGRHLAPQLRAEAARRGQPVPKVRLPS